MSRVLRLPYPRLLMRNVGLYFEMRLYSGLTRTNLTRGGFWGTNDEIPKPRLGMGGGTPHHSQTILIKSLSLIICQNLSRTAPCPECDVRCLLPRAADVQDREGYRRGRTRNPGAGWYDIRDALVSVRLNVKLHDV